MIRPSQLVRSDTSAVVKLAALVVAILLAGGSCSPSSEPGTDTSPDETGPPVDAATDGDRTTADGDVADSTDSSEQSLVSQTEWAQLEADGDPFASHRPASVDCPSDALELEELNGEQTFSINTGSCNYLAVGQPTLVDIAEGDTLKVRVWHFELSNDGSAEAHAALAVDDKTVWERTISLPTSSGDLLSDSWTAEQDIPAGTEVVFHLHNHGNNSWNFIEFTRVDG